MLYLLFLTEFILTFVAHSMSKYILSLQSWWFTSCSKPKVILGQVPNMCLLFIYLGFTHYTGHITAGSLKGRGNQYIQFIRVLYCKLPTNGKQLPAFPLEAIPGTKPQPQRWEGRVLPLCHRGPLNMCH